MYSNLNQKIIIQSKTTASVSTVSSGGCYTETWGTASITSSSTVWASVQIDRNLEDWQKEKGQQMNWYDIIIRKGVNITKNHRIKYGTKILTIEALEDMSQKGRYTHVKCREEVGN